MSLKSQVVASLQWSAGTKLLGQLANWAITIVVIRLLAPGDYGLMAMANVVLGFLAMIAEMGFGASLVQTRNWDRERVRRLFAVALVVNGVFALSLVLSAPILAAFFQEPRLAAVIEVICLQFVLNSLATVPDAMLRRDLKFKRLSIIDIGSAVSGNLVTMLLALTEHGVWSLVAGALFGALTRVIALQFSIRDLVLPQFRFGGVRGLASFGAGVTATRVLSYITSQADIFIAGKLLGRDAVGIYAVAVNLATLPMQRGQAVINDVAFSAFAKIQHDVGAVASNLALAIRLTALIAFPTMWGLAAVSPEVVRLALGEQWLAVIVPMQIIALTIPFRMVSALIATVRMSVGRIDLSVRTAFAGVLVVPLAFLVGSHYGLLGLAVAWVGIAPVYFFLSTYGAAASLGMRQRNIGRNLVQPLISALAMVIVLVLLRSKLAALGDAPRLALMFAAGIVSYGVATALFNRKAASEAVGLVLPDSRKRTVSAASSGNA